MSAEPGKFTTKTEAAATSEASPISANRTSSAPAAEASVACDPPDSSGIPKTLIESATSETGKASEAFNASGIFPTSRKNVASATNTPGDHNPPIPLSPASHPAGVPTAQRLGAAPPAENNTVQKNGVTSQAVGETSSLNLFWPIALNVALFGIFGVDAAKRVWRTTQAGTFDFVEISFAVQTAVMVLMILWRHRHRAVDPSLWNQAVAMIAVFSGLMLTDLPAGDSAGLALTAKIIVFVANVLGIMTLLNLGRSFGFLIALREVRTTGLYGVIRHPMYFTDILLRVGYVLANFSTFNVAVFLVSGGAYVYRAILEERFLMQAPEYREFASRVRYRFLPGVF